MRDKGQGTGDKGQETGDKRQETGDRRQETRDKGQETTFFIILCEELELHAPRRSHPSTRDKPLCHLDMEG